MAEEKPLRVKVGETLDLSQVAPSIKKAPPGVEGFEPAQLEKIEAEVEPEVIQPLEPTPTLKPIVAPPTPEPPREVYNPYLLPGFDRERVPSAPAPEEKPLVIDIETTGFKPWESRLICIGIKDPTKPDDDPIVILDENEPLMIEWLFKYIKTEGFNALIGYNIAFDFRYLFTRAMLYRIPCEEFHNMKLHDVMQVLGQVKEAFIYKPPVNTNMQTWSKLLLGMEKTLTTQQLFDAYKKGEWDKVMQYNGTDVEICTQLWNLIEFTRRTPFFLETPVAQKTEQRAGSITCSSCLSENILIEGQTKEVCDVCGAKLTQQVT